MPRQRKANPIPQSQRANAHHPTDDTRRIVEAGAAYGVTQHVLALMMGISKTTLDKHYRDELDLGKAKATMAVANNLFRMATGKGREAATCAIFFLKTMAVTKWKQTDPEIDPTQVPVALTLEGQEMLSADEYATVDEARRILDRVSKRGGLVRASGALPPPDRPKPN